MNTAPNLDAAHSAADSALALGGGAFIVVVLVLGLILTILGILMPLYVWRIHKYTKDTARELAKLTKLQRQLLRAYNITPEA